MNALPWYDYLLVVVAAVSVTLILTPLALRLAVRLEILDRPSATKAQESPVPYLGGLAMVIAFSLVIGAAALIDPPTGGAKLLIVVLATAIALSVIGVLDEIRGLGVTIRLVAEVAAASIMWAYGTRAELFTGHIRGGRLLDAIITVLWIVGVTNAFNMLDNMDGLSAGVAAIASLSLFVVAYINGQFLVATLALALAGCAFGFLRHNFHPAKIYMGDAGSLYLGFLLAVLSLRLRTHEVSRLTFIVPVLLVGAALFDATLVVSTRLLHHQNPLVGGRDHTSHRLVVSGVPVRTTVAMIYAASVALGWTAIIISQVDRETAYLLGGLVLAVAIFLGVLLACVPIDHENTNRVWESDGVQHLEIIAAEEPRIQEVDIRGISDEARRFHIRRSLRRRHVGPNSGHSGPREGNA